MSKCYIFLFCCLILCYLSSFIFFFNDTATTEIYTLSLHDALPIYGGQATHVPAARDLTGQLQRTEDVRAVDRKSTRLNSSHLGISYAVFCLKKKKKNNINKKYKTSNDTQQYYLKINRQSDHSSTRE